MSRPCSGSASGTLVAQWLENTDPQIEAYNLRMSYSKDDGKTWAASFLPHNDGTKSQHGFASMFDLPGNGLGVVWLDGRNSAFDFDKPDTGHDGAAVCVVRLEHEADG